MPCDEPCRRCERPGHDAYPDPAPRGSHRSRRDRDRHRRAGGGGMSGPRLGVMTFSLCGDLWRRRMSIDESLAAVASLGPGQELELIGSLALPGFPHLDAGEVAHLRGTIERLGLVPSVYCTDLDRGRSPSRTLSQREALELVEPEAAVARALGLPGPSPQRGGTGPARGPGSARRSYRVDRAHRARRRAAHRCRHRRAGRGADPAGLRACRAHRRRQLLHPTAAGTVEAGVPRRRCTVTRARPGDRVVGPRAAPPRGDRRAARHGPRPARARALGVRAHDLPVPVPQGRRAGSARPAAARSPRADQVLRHGRGRRRSVRALRRDRPPAEGCRLHRWPARGVRGRHLVGRARHRGGAPPSPGVPDRALAERPDAVGGPGSCLGPPIGVRRPLRPHGSACSDATLSCVGVYSSPIGPE